MQSWLYKNLGLATKKDLQLIQIDEEKRLETAVAQVINAVDPINNYNEAIYGWLNDNQPIYYDDRATNYVKYGYMGNQDVYSCIDKIITKLASCPSELVEINNTDIPKLQKYRALMRSDSFDSRMQAKVMRVTELKSMKPVFEPTISKILSKPNPRDTWRDFVRNWAGYKLITGNAYTYLNGPNPDAKRWSEMYVLPSHYMQIVSGGTFMPVKGYRLLGQGHYYQSQNIAFTANQVVHTKTFNPDFSTVGSQLYGMSPLKAYLITLAMNPETRKEMYKQLKNGGALGFVSPKESDKMLTAQQRDDLKEQFKRAKEGDTIFDRIFASSGPLDWNQIGLPSTDLQMIQSLELNQKDIYTCYKVPIQLANNTASSTDNNMAWAAKQFVYNAVMPEADEMDDMLTEALCSPMNANSWQTGKSHAIMTDCTALPEMQEDMTKVAEWLAKCDWLTYNEKREVLKYGRSTLEGTDELFIDSNKILLRDAMAMSSAITDPNANPNNPDVQL